MQNLIDGLTDCTGNGPAKTKEGKTTEWFVITGYGPCHLSQLGNRDVRFSGLVTDSVRNILHTLSATEPNVSKPMPAF